VHWVFLRLATKARNEHYRPEMYKDAVKSKKLVFELTKKNVI